MRRGLDIELHDEDLRTLFGYGETSDSFFNLPMETKASRSLRTRSTSRAASLQVSNEDTTVLPPSTPASRRVTRSTARMTPSTQPIVSSKLLPSSRENDILSSENDSESLVDHSSLLSSARVLRSTRKGNTIMETMTVEAVATPSKPKRTRKRSSSYFDESNTGDQALEQPLMEEDWSQRTSDPSEPQHLVKTTTEPVKPATRSRKPREIIPKISVSESDDLVKLPNSSQEIDNLEPSSGKSSYPTRRSSRKDPITEDTSRVLADMSEPEGSSRRKTRNRRLHEG